jgi:uncharacterized protein with PIN domain
MGVPHTELGRILADGRPVGFDHIPRNGCFIRPLPVEPPLDVTRPTVLRPRPFDRLHFIVDVNVGKLALLLRMLGLDTAYSPEWTDREISERAAGERRTVLTRDVELLKYSRIRYGRHVRAALPDAQLVEVVGFFGIQGPFQIFSRCLRCNTKLEAVAKDLILDRLEPKTRKYYHHFKRCPTCGRIYWRGSHQQRMVERLQNAGLEIDRGESTAN